MVKENIKEILEDYKGETMRHFDVVMERLKNEIRVHIKRIKKIRRAGFATPEKRVSLLEAKIS